MARGYFLTLEIDNDQEIEIVDQFLKEVEHEYIGKERNGVPKPLNEIGKPLSSNKTEILTVLGLIACFLLLIIVMNNENRFLFIFALLGLIGYGTTYIQLTRSEHYVESIKSVCQEVHDYRNKVKQEEDLEKRIKERMETKNESNVG